MYFLPQDEEGSKTKEEKVEKHVYSLGAQVFRFFFL